MTTKDFIALLRNKASDYRYAAECLERAADAIDRCESRFSLNAQETREWEEEQARDAHRREVEDALRKEIGL